MSAPSAPCGFRNGGSHAKLHNSQSQHQDCFCRARATIRSEFGGDALLRHRQGSFLQVGKQLTCSTCACKISGYGNLLSHPSYYDRHGRRSEGRCHTFFVGACVCYSSLLQFEQQNPCLTTDPFSRFGLPGFEGLSQHQVTRIQAHSQQHLSLQEDQERLLHIQERRDALQNYETSILDSITQNQASLQQSAILSTNLQIEGETNGYAPAGIDVSSCRSVFVGNLHKRVSNTFLAEVFSTVGPLVACKVIKKAKSSYGFVDYQDHHAAAMAISTLNGKELFRSPIRVNWAFPGEVEEGSTEHRTIFVGSLSAEVTEAVLFKSFSAYPSCSAARVVWEPRRGRSKGYGFVSFTKREDAVKAIEEMTGKLIGDKAIHCAWAAGRKTIVEKPAEDKAESYVEQVIKNNPRYTSVYVGNLPHKISREELREIFDGLHVGSIEEVHIAKSKGFGFVKYSTHEEAALAIQAGDGKRIGEKPMKCSWGTKPNSLMGLSDSRPPMSPVDPPSEPSPVPPSIEPVEGLTLLEG